MCITAYEVESVNNMYRLRLDECCYQRFNLHPLFQIVYFFTIV